MVTLTFRAEISNEGLLSVDKSVLHRKDVISTKMVGYTETVLKSPKKSWKRKTSYLERWVGIWAVFWRKQRIWMWFHERSSSLPGKLKKEASGKAQWQGSVGYMTHGEAEWICCGHMEGRVNPGRDGQEESWCLVRLGSNSVNTARDKLSFSWVGLHKSTFPVLGTWSETTQMSRLTGHRLLPFSPSQLSSLPPPSKLVSSFEELHHLFGFQCHELSLSIPPREKWVHTVKQKS